MQRYCLQTLIEWKNKKGRKPMIIQGARQVGKTWLAQEFGRTQYQNVAYINFDKNERMKELFSSNLEISRLISGMEIELGIKITQQNTLLIFDEIQESPRALTSLKYFCEEAPEYHILAAGSLLGVALTHKGMSFPVGKVEFMDLAPMSFYEFLDAIGENMLCDALKDLKLDLLKSFKTKCEELLKTYFYVGGMPEVVKTFVKNKDYSEVRELQNTILKSYENYFSKHIDAKDTPKVQMIWDSIPAQLSKPNPKFVYGLLKEGARAKEFKNALLWLTKTGLVHQVTKLNKPGLPIYAYEDRSSFKLFMIDIGLYCAKSMLDVKTLLEKTNIFKEFKGSLTEQYVLQQLKLLPTMPITYWESRNAELDFVIQKANDIIPIEVKASINLQAKSLKAYMDKYTPNIAIRTSLADYKQADNLYDIPLFVLESLNEILEDKI